jgi:hypothetical protein
VVKPYKDDSLYWHNKWLQEGEPSAGPTYEIMHEAKRLYHYGACRLTRREKYTRLEFMAANVVNNKSRDFWSEVKKMRQARTVAPMIDGRTEKADIANLFKEKYQTLYPSVPSSEEHMTDRQ